MKKILGAVVAALIVGMVLLVPAATVEAQGIWGGCDESINKDICGDTTDAETIAERIVNLFLYAIGILSVIMIIHGGLKYVSSRGDPEMVKSAKNTLMYAVIGLIVALLSFAIVNFVVDSFDSSTEEDDNSQVEEADG